MYLYHIHFLNSSRIKKSKRNKEQRTRKRRRVAEMRAKEGEQFKKHDREADEWRLMKLPRTWLHKSVQEFKKEVGDLSRSVEMHVCDNNELQRLSSELEKGKQDVEQHLTDLEQENLQLSEKNIIF